MILIESSSKKKIKDMTPEELKVYFAENQAKNRAIKRNLAIANGEQFQKRGRPRVDKWQGPKRPVGARKLNRSEEEWWIIRTLDAAKARAKKFNREFSITKEDFKIPPTHCPVLGFKLDYSLGKGKKTFQDNSPSIDRVDSSKDYIKSNVKIISWKANKIKRNFNIEELTLILKYMVNHENETKGT